MLANPSHQFDDDAQYLVTLTVTDDDGLVDSASTLATIANVVPVANAGGPYTGREDRPIAFSGSAADPGSDALIFAWDFTYDGETFHRDREGLDLNIVTHEYDAPGEYVVALRVTDDDMGESDISIGAVTVSESSVGDPEHPWQNAVAALDVDDDGEIVPLDALLIINYLNEHGSHALPVPIIPPDGPPPFLDVDGDDWIAPIDALLVINELNRQHDAEAETASPPIAPDSLRRPIPVARADMYLLDDVWPCYLFMDRRGRYESDLLDQWFAEVDRTKWDWRCESSVGSDQGDSGTAA
jgi:PKD repeat protein